MLAKRSTVTAPPNGRPAGSPKRARLGWCLAGALCLGATNEPPAQPEVKTPETPREFVNAGTRKLQEGKWREAEAFLETGLASQVEKIQVAALYNLGHVRFQQGIEELKKSPDKAASRSQGQAAAESAGGAVQEAAAALETENVERLVAAYLRGRGSRRELKAATKAVRAALQAHGSALGRWQRASGDFKSDVELKPDDADARHNAEVVDRNIAKLVDSLRELEQMANALGQKKQELDEKMKQLKGRIPEPNMPPGAPGDDEEEEDQPEGPKPGEKEGPTKDGQEMPISPEQASWLLQGFKLDADRRLPMGQNAESEPRKRDRPTW